MTTTMKKTFGENLKAARKKAGLSQSQAALRAGVRQPHWTLYERNIRSPRLEMAYKLAEAVGAELEELV